MEEELKGSNLHWDDASEGIDIDTNLLHNLFESHMSSIEQNQQRGQSITPGPASLLLAQLGVSLSDLASSMKHTR